VGPSTTANNSSVNIDWWALLRVALCLHPVTIHPLPSSVFSQLLTSTEYLIRRHQTWYVRVQIPKKLWEAAEGKREFVKSLGTRDLTEANSRKHAHITEYKRQIKALLEARRDPLRKARMRALAWRDAIEDAKGESIHFEGDEGPTDMSGVLQSEALDEVKEMAGTIGEEPAERGQWIEPENHRAALIVPFVPLELARRPWGCPQRQQPVAKTTAGEARKAWAGEAAKPMERRATGQTPSR
jgi:hypothetical protein